MSTPALYRWFVRLPRATLGTGGPTTLHSNFPGAPLSGTWYTPALADKLAGYDLEPVVNDIATSFNVDLDGGGCDFPRDWYYGVDANPPVGTLDFVTVALHEIGHGLGFITFANPETGAIGLQDAYLMGLEDHSIGQTFWSMTDAQRAAASQKSGQLHWVGPTVSARAAQVLSSGVSAGGHPHIYAPSPVAPGSSLSHFATTLDPPQVMSPYLLEANHDVGLAADVLVDMGWGSACGNGIVEGDEECDDANANDSDCLRCHLSCRIGGGALLGGHRLHHGWHLFGFRPMHRRPARTV